jgi:hypothetical protein
MMIQDGPSLTTWSFSDMVFEEYANVYLDFHRPSASGDATRKLAQDGFGEALNRSYAAHLFQTVVARRPE